MNGKKFLLSKEEKRRAEIVKKVLKANGAKDVKSICIGTDEKRIVEVFGDVPLNNYPDVLLGISGASNKGEEFDHKREDGFLVISLKEVERSEELTGTRRKSRAEILAGLQKKTGIAGINMV